MKNYLTNISLSEQLQQGGEENKGATLNLYILKMAFIILLFLILNILNVDNISNVEASVLNC